MGDNLGKVCVLVGLECSTANTEALNKLGVALAMHVAAGKPLYNTVADIPAADLEKEKNIFVQQAMESGKPKDIAEKMTAGRIKKWQVCSPKFTRMQGEKDVEAASFFWTGISI